MHVLVPPRGDADAAALRAAATSIPVIAMVDRAADLTLLRDAAVGVTIKLATSMRRFGAAIADVPALAAAVTPDHALDGFAAHLPLAGTATARVDEAAALLAALDALPAELPRRLSLSHVEPTDLAALRSRWPAWELRVRIGSALWHGAKHELHLGTDVVAVTPIAAGETAGYHATPAPADGWIVVVGAGSAHGIAPLADGRSPFHHRRRRIDLLEGPHMHTTLLFVAAPGTPPAIGETVDVQRPLTNVTADETIWR